MDPATGPEPAIAFFEPESHERARSLWEFLNLRHQRVIGDQRLPSSENIFVTNDACFIDNEVRALRQTPLRIQYPVGSQRLEVGKIADHRKIDLQEVGERFLRERRVGAYRDDFRVYLLELLVIVPTGRKFLDSSGSKVEDVKLDENVFRALETAQLEFASLGARQLKVRRFVADLNCRRGRYP